MKKYLFIAFVLLSFIGCSPKYTDYIYDDTYIYDSIESVIRERLEVVTTDPDSAYIEALLECDEHGELLLRCVEQESSKNVSLSLKIDSMGRLLAGFNTKPQKVYVTVHDTTYIEKNVKEETKIEQKTEEPKTVYVEKKLNWLHRARMTIGTIALALIALLVIARISFYFKYRK